MQQRGWDFVIGQLMLKQQNRLTMTAGLTDLSANSCQYVSVTILTDFHSHYGLRLPAEG